MKKQKNSEKKNANFGLKQQDENIIWYCDVPVS